MHLWAVITVTFYRKGKVRPITIIETSGFMQTLTKLGQAEEIDQPLVKEIENRIEYILLTIRDQYKSMCQCFDHQSHLSEQRIIFLL